MRRLDTVYSFARPLAVCDLRKMSEERGVTRYYLLSVQDGVVTVSEIDNIGVRKPFIIPRETWLCKFFEHYPLNISGIPDVVLTVSDEQRFPSEIPEAME